MSRSEAGLVIFASLLMATLVITYVCQEESLEGVGPFKSASSGSAKKSQFPEVTVIQEDKYEDWTPPTLPQHLKSVDQEDPELIKHIQTSWILAPQRKLMRRLSHPEMYDHSEYGQSFVVDKLLHGLEKGFYVDVWAGNGETNSNTLFMEKDRHWNGLLIEPNPIQYRKLVGKRRQGYVLQACVSPTTRPSVLNLTYGEELEKTILVQCFPLYSILQALGVQHVDYLSIKSQHELDILKTLPLGQNKPLSIETITIETQSTSKRKEMLAKNEDIKQLMTSLGYRWVDAGERINRKNVILQRDRGL
jgi:hypothetical protein